MEIIEILGKKYLKFRVNCIDQIVYISIDEISSIEEHICDISNPSYHGTISLVNTKDGKSFKPDNRFKTNKLIEMLKAPCKCIKCL